MKRKTAYVCSECGATALQWFGSCPSCGTAGTLTETIPPIMVNVDPQDIAAADLNDDGLPDLVTSNLGSGGVSVILSGA